MSNTEDKPFQTEKQIITLTNGETIELPRLTIGKIMAVTDAMNSLVEQAKEKAPQVMEIFSASESGVSVGAQVVKVLPQLLPLLMNEIVNVLSIYLNMDKQKIKDEMDMEDLVAVATPFFASITKQANHVVGALNHLMPKNQTTDLSQ